VNVTKAAAAVGVGTTAARDDHKHDVTTAAAVSISTSNAEGTATSLARSDHVHSHGHALLQQLMFAPDFDDPGTDWAVTAAASLNADTVNAAVLIRRFDDTTQEGVGWSVHIPSAATQVTFTFMAKAQSSPAGTRTVGLALKKREVPNNATLGSWTSTTLTDLSFPTNVTFQKSSQTVSLATLSLTAGSIYQLEIIRQTPAAGTNLTGDMGIFMLNVEWFI